MLRSKPLLLSFPLARYKNRDAALNEVGEEQCAIVGNALRSNGILDELDLAVVSATAASGLTVSLCIDISYLSLPDAPPSSMPLFSSTRATRMLSTTDANAYGCG